MMASKYDNMTVEELQQEAAAKGVEGRSSMNKEELQAALKGNRGEQSGDRQTATRTAEGTPPEVGEEGGVVKEGTGDFKPGLGVDQGAGPTQTIPVETASGGVAYAEVGLDGESAVSPQNPPKKAAIGGSNPVQATVDEGAEPRKGGPTAESFDADREGADKK
jgi:hypothetical protein